LWIKVKRKQIYIEKKIRIKKKEFNTIFCCNFICGLLIFYLQSVFLLESPCCLL